MSVYVDDYEAPYGRMIMSHMIADTREELDEMADKIGVARRWIQCEGTYKEHYDICQSARTKAIRFGALAISPRELVAITLTKRKTTRQTEHEIH